MSSHKKLSFSLIACLFFLAAVVSASAQAPCDSTAPPELTCQDIELALGDDGMANLFSASALYSTNAISFLYQDCAGPYESNPDAFVISAERNIFTCSDMYAPVSVPIVVLMADGFSPEATCTVNVTITDPLGVCAVAEGEGEVLPEGEGEVLPEGEGEVVEEGEGEVMPEGEGEVVEEGEGEVVEEGEGEIVEEGEGEVPVEGEPECTGEFEVPDVVGETLSDATAILNANCFVVGAVTEECSDDVPKGCVISQDPGAGSVALGGSAVDLVISTGRCACCDGFNPLDPANLFLGALALLALIIASIVLSCGGGGGSFIKLPW